MEVASADGRTNDERGGVTLASRYRARTAFKLHARSVESTPKIRLPEWPFAALAGHHTLPCGLEFRSWARISRSRSAITGAERVSLILRTILRSFAGHAAIMRWAVSTRAHPRALANAFQPRSNSTPPPPPLVRFTYRTCPTKRQHPRRVEEGVKIGARTGQEFPLLSVHFPHGM